jgi:hypothetical protein
MLATLDVLCIFKNFLIDWKHTSYPSAPLEKRGVVFLAWSCHPHHAYPAHLSRKMVVKKRESLIFLAKCHH